MVHVLEEYGYRGGVCKVLDNVNAIEEVHHIHHQVCVKHGIDEVGGVQHLHVSLLLPEAVLRRDPAIDVICVLKHVSCASDCLTRQRVLKYCAIEPL